MPHNMGMARVRRPRTGYWPCLLGALWSVIWPGAGHLVIHRKVKGIIHTLTFANLAATFVVLVIVAPVRNRAGLAYVIADRSDFVALAISLVVMAFSRLWCTLDAAFRSRPRNAPIKKTFAALTSAVLVVVGVAPLTVAADYVWQTDRMLERVFASHEAITAMPAPITDDGSPIVTTPVAQQPSGNANTSAFSGMARVNILLIGGDSGPGRYSTRTDTLMVASIDPASGDTALISIPRNLPALPFPPGTPLAERFPDGFDNIVNGLYPYVMDRKELAGGGDDAGAQALKQGMAQFLGIPIHYYVMVDMLGFVDIIDALGGIDIYVSKKVTTPLNPEEGMEEPPEYIEIGQHHMDGTIALSYARSRYVDSDYGRMGRQRCVIAAIANAAEPMSVALGLGELVSAFGNAVRTDIPRTKLGDFAQLIDRYAANGGIKQVRSLHLAPPTFDPSSWTLPQVRTLVATTLIPGLKVNKDDTSKLMAGCTAPAETTGAAP